VRGHHPDSWAWGRKWRNGKTGLVGPVVCFEPAYPSLIQPKERIIYLPIYEAGWPIQKEQKRGLREALATIGLVIEYDYVTRHQELGKALMLTELMRLCQRISPTIILTQLHNGVVINAGDIQILRSASPGAKFLNWNGDYWPENLVSQDGLALARAFDLQTTVNRAVLDEYQAKGINAAYWQIGWEPDGVGYEPDTWDDIVFLGSGYSQARQQFVKRLKALDGFSLGLYGSGWPDGWAKGQCLYDFKTACRIYRGAKISLGDSQWPDSGFVSNRVMQALAAGGAALAHQWFRGMDELGLVDGETCIIWHEFSELEEKMHYYIGHEDERRRVAGAGERLALERHSFEARVRELLQMIKFSELQEESWR
ncbi:MAG: glycosyltransferase family protein, partial [Nitrospiria bacterium]